MLGRHLNFVSVLICFFVTSFWFWWFLRCLFFFFGWGLLAWNCFSDFFMFLLILNEQEIDCFLVADVLLLVHHFGVICVAHSRSLYNWRNRAGYGWLRNVWRTRNIHSHVPLRRRVAILSVIWRRTLILINSAHLLNVIGNRRRVNLRGVLDKRLRNQSRVVVSILRIERNRSLAGIVVLLSRNYCYALWNIVVVIHLVLCWWLSDIDVYCRGLSRELLLFILLIIIVVIWLLLRKALTNSRDGILLDLFLSTALDALQAALLR